MTKDITASIQARLLNHAKQRGDDYNLTLNRYAIERFLYRLSISSVRKAFCLKGALLFDLWFDIPHRPTRDADFLGIGPQDSEVLANTIREICQVQVTDDGMVFDPSSITAEEIREEANYGGLRIKLLGKLGNSRCVLQLDVGYGDAVTPSPEEINYPTILDDQPAPRLLIYPRATVAAEKIEALVSLGMANSRMKDYFDLRALAREGIIDAQLLGQAISATFKRRGTTLPTGIPIGLSNEFALDPTKQTQWKAFLNKNRLEAPTLEEVIKEIRAFIDQPLASAWRD